MTGFAKRQCDINGKRITIEIKTLNSKQLDTIVKVPNAYRSRELEIRTMLNRLQRGKVEIALAEEVSGASESQLNTTLARSRHDAIRQLSEEMGAALSSEAILATLITQSELWNSNSTEELTEESWGEIERCVAAAIDEVETFREEEGEILKKDITKHLDLIEQKLGEIPQYEAGRIETAKERIRKYIAESAIKEIDSNRFEQELIYYLEKFDITEEKVRLQKHIAYFRTTMEEANSGKKLGFIAQEMGREINTTGSKANQVDIQRLVVEMKDELEKIKEQLGNIL